MYLYVKTHNVTGLKYFGFTTSKDPFKYKGSGLYWKRHLIEHGNNVSTEIIGEYISREDASIVAKKFSIENDIVNSDRWANLVIEDCFGGFDHINNNKSLDQGMLPEERKQQRKYAAQKSKEYLENLKIYNPEKYRERSNIISKHTKLKNELAKENKSNFYGKDNPALSRKWITNTETGEHKYAHIDTLTEYLSTKIWVLGRKGYTFGKV